MSDLVDFLLARIAEDEREARRDLDAFVAEHGLAELAWEAWGSQYCNPRRALAECEARRRIVEYLEHDLENMGERWVLLTLLALPYADHPDYRDEWKERTNP